MAEPSVVQLIQKITRAQVKLEAMKRQHSTACPSEDPQMAGECTCGASKLNTDVTSVLNELKLENA